MHTHMHIRIHTNIYKCIKCLNSYLINRILKTIIKLKRNTYKISLRPRIFIYAHIQTYTNV